MCETKKQNHCLLHNIPTGTVDDNETLETAYLKTMGKHKHIPISACETRPYNSHHQ